MEQVEKKSVASGFLSGALKIAAVAAIGLTLFAAGTAIFPAVAAAGGWLSAGGWGALAAGATWKAAGAAIAAKFSTGMAAWLIGGSALAGGVMGTLATNKYNEDVEMYQRQMTALNTPTQGLGRGQSKGMDFSGVDTGVPYKDNWAQTVRQQPAAGQAPNVAQPVARV